MWISLCHIRVSILENPGQSDWASCKNKIKFDQEQWMETLSAGPGGSPLVVGGANCQKGANEEKLFTMLRFISRDSSLVTWNKKKGYYQCCGSVSLNNKKKKNITIFWKNVNLFLPEFLRTSKKIHEMKSTLQK